MSKCDRCGKTYQELFKERPLVVYEDHEPLLAFVPTGGQLGDGQFLCIDCRASVRRRALRSRLTF